MVNGHSVVGVDPNNVKVDFLRRGESPIVEPGLAELIAAALAGGGLVAGSDYAKEGGRGANRRNFLFDCTRFWLRSGRADARQAKRRRSDVRLVAIPIKEPDAGCVSAMGASTVTGALRGAPQEADPPLVSSERISFLNGWRCAALPACFPPWPWRGQPLLRPFLRQHTAHLCLLFLPPCSAQLASIERGWKLTRRRATHNRYFATLDEVLQAVNVCFDRWCQPNKVLRRLYCIT